MRRAWRCGLAVLLWLAAADAGEAAPLEAFAAQAAQAAERGAALPSLTAAHPDATLADAVSVQKRFVALRIAAGERFGGIKGAAVSPAALKLLNVSHPLSAVLFARGRQDVNAALSLSYDPAVPPVVETEIAFVIGARIDKAPATIAELKPLIRAVAPAIELPAAPHAWSGPPSARDLVAVNIDSARYLIGPAGPPPEDLDTQTVRLTRNGEILHAVPAGSAVGGQWANALRQVRWAVEQGYTLEPGHVVITGALGTLSTAQKGRYRAEFGTLGTLEFELTPAAPSPAPAPAPATK